MVSDRVRDYGNGVATWRDWMIGGALGALLFLIVLVLACYV